MHTTAKALGIDRLSLAERILLLEEIWDSIPGEGLSGAQQDSGATSA